MEIKLIFGLAFYTNTLSLRIGTNKPHDEKPVTNDFQLISLERNPLNVKRKYLYEQLKYHGIHESPDS